MRANSRTFIFVVSFCLSQPALGQIATGTIFGNVKDSSGAVIPGASIILTNESTGVTRKAVTSGTGDYVVAQLPPGTYSVTASHPGFQAKTVSGVVLTVTARTPVDFALSLGAVTQQVTVKASVTQLETGSSSLGQIIDEKRVTNLPLNGRSFVQLAALGTGATPVISSRQDEGSALAAKTLSLNISGSRGNWNSWLVDGVETKQDWFNTPSILLSVDAIQEFKVMQSNSSAEYGGASATINVVTKSGTNQFHGTGYEFLRNNHLDARNFFDESRPQFKQNQLGGGVGGPIIRDRAFFFFNYEGLRTRKGNTLIATVPDPTQLGGNFSSSSKPLMDPKTGKPFPGNVMPLDRFSGVSKNFLSFIPPPNRSLAAKNLVVVPTTQTDFNQYAGRVDYVVSNKDSIFGRYLFQDWTRTNPGFAPLFGFSLPLSGQNFTVQQTHTFGPTFINTFRAAYNRAILFNSFEKSGEDLSAKLGLSGISSRGLPGFSITGFSFLGGGALDQGAFTNSYELSDTLTLVKGKHEIAAGFDVRFRQFQKVSDLFANGSFSFDGRFTGNSLADFLLGLPALAQGQSGRSIVNLRSKAYGGYLQDDYKVSPRLTLNLGIRYDYEQPWSEIDNKEGVFDTAFPGGRLIVSRNPADFGLTVAPDLKDRFVIGGLRRGEADPDFNNFSPHIGLASSVLPNTVLRAAYGIFYVEPNGNEQAAKQQMPPFQITRVFFGTPATPVSLDDLFPSGAILTGILSPQGGLVIHHRTPYVQQWSFSIQHKLRSALFEVAYSGATGMKLDSRVNINQAVPSPPGQVTPVQPRRPFPLWGDILTRFFRDRSNYNAFELKVQQSTSRGFSFLASYTVSKSIDSQSRLGATEHQDSRNLDADRGLSAFDVRQNFTLSYTFELPFGRGKHFLGNASRATGLLVNGWEVNGITTFLAGIPFNPTAPPSGANVGGFTALRANRLGSGFLSRRTPEKWFDTSAFALPPFGTFGNSGRDVLIGPGTSNFDFSLFKNTRLGERLTVQFRTEFFDLFNRPNFNLPVDDITNPNFGKILSARDPREIQFALKFIF